MDALLRNPLANSTQAATIVFGEHVLLVLVFLPIIVAALPALWRAGPRYVAAGIVVGAGSSALATILFTEAFVRGDPVTPVVLQKVQPLVAVLLAAAILGERPRPRFGLFLAAGLAGTWLMAFPSPFDVSLHGTEPALLALGAAGLWALGTVLGRFLTLRLAFQQVTAVRFAFGLPASFVAVLVLGAPLTASWHDMVFIALLALVTGLGRGDRRADLPSRGDRRRLPRLRFDADRHAARWRRADELRRHAPSRPGPNARRATTRPERGLEAA
jgi:drug/metabolite transporter (DMT)-like permease